MAVGERGVVRDQVFASLQLNINCTFITYQTAVLYRYTVYGDQLHVRSMQNEAIFFSIIFAECARCSTASR